ncbi:hypothetical protein ACIQCW_12885, partial [Pseudarthrobacter sp. NPDC092401]|uniref:hypothetical protein n=1 Tax=Pseudarthrobacter sp. NPDC092401 TaxID=3364413 RepID=UPI003805085A
GTLLSSQTTDTPGTTQTNVQDRSGATFQTYPIPRPNANPSSRTHQDKKPPRQLSSALKSNQKLALKFGGFATRGTQLFAVSLAAT